MHREPKVHVNALNEVAKQLANRLHTIPLRFFPSLTPSDSHKKTEKNVCVQLTAFVWKSEQCGYLLLS